jgi:hypothetical protein
VNFLFLFFFKVIEILIGMISLEAGRQVKGLLQNDGVCDLEEYMV